jgi:hypothetical protein
MDGECEWIKKKSTLVRVQERIAKNIIERDDEPVD